MACATNSLIANGKILFKPTSTRWHFTTKLPSGVNTVFLPIVTIGKYVESQCHIVSFYSGYSPHPTHTTK